MFVFLLVSSINISGQYKNTLISRTSDFRNSVFTNVDEGNDFQQKEALRKTEKEWDKELEHCISENNESR